MNRSIDFSQLGGLYIYQDTLDFLQQAYGQALDALANIFGDKLILTGVQDQGATVNPGWVVYQGQILPFAGGLKAPNVALITAQSQEQYDDGSQKNAYTTNTLQFVNQGGFPFTDLHRLPFGTATIYDGLNAVQTLFNYIINQESAVILNGCTVTVTGSTLQVTTGVLLLTGAVVDTTAYNGAFPAYMKTDGTWATVAPTDGSAFITFDPNTSQHYVDVMRRALTPTGEIKMFETLSDRFDATGMGRWEMLGFQLLSSMQGRVPLGLWFDGQTVNNVTDPAYKTIPTQGGGNTVVLQKTNLPNVTIPIDGYKGDDYLGGGSPNTSLIGEGQASNPHFETGIANTEALGSGTPIDIRQPYNVIVYAKRTA
jgi:hypothetical protein